MPNQDQFELKAYKKYPLSHANPQALSNHMREFLHLHKLQNAYGVIGLSSAALIEKTIPISKFNEEQAPSEFAKLIWDYQPHNDAKSIYLCGIKRENLAQYQLMCIQAQLNCIAITSEQAIKNCIQSGTKNLFSKFNCTEDENRLYLGMYTLGNSL